MIVATPKLLSDEWMLIGSQEDTGFGGRIDPPAIAPDGALVLIELKRDKTPRDVVAQSLDYASWVDKLRAGDIAAICGRFAPGRNLAEDFQQRFGLALDEDSLNESHHLWPPRSRLGTDAGMPSLRSRSTSRLAASRLIAERPRFSSSTALAIASAGRAGLNLPSTVHRRSTSTTSPLVSRPSNPPAPKVSSTAVGQHDDLTDQVHIFRRPNRRHRRIGNQQSGRCPADKDHFLAQIVTQPLGDDLQQGHVGIAGAHGCKRFSSRSIASARSRATAAHRIEEHQQLVQRRVAPGRIRHPRV